MTIVPLLTAAFFVELPLLFIPTSRPLATLPPELMPTLWCSTWYSARFSMLLKPGVPCIAGMSDDAVNVLVMNGCLMLTAEIPPTEPEVIQALRQLCPKLSARNKRELMDVIQVMAKPQKRGGN
ncbi:hypothetical protein [Erwinia persicina]|nr:hypothetical protein [Erwinia persicina]